MAHGREPPLDRRLEVRAIALSTRVLRDPEYKNIKGGAHKIGYQYAELTLFSSLSPRDP